MSNNNQNLFNLVIPEDDDNLPIENIEDRDVIFTLKTVKWNDFCEYINEYHTDINRFTVVNTTDTNFENLLNTSKKIIIRNWYDNLYMTSTDNRLPIILESNNYSIHSIRVFMDYNDSGITYIIYIKDKALDNNLAIPINKLIKYTVIVYIPMSQYNKRKRKIIGIAKNDFEEDVIPLYNETAYYNKFFYIRNLSIDDPINIKINKPMQTFRSLNEDITENDEILFSNISVPFASRIIYFKHNSYTKLFNLNNHIKYNLLDASPVMLLKMLELSKRLFLI